MAYQIADVGTVPAFKIIKGGGIFIGIENKISYLSSDMTAWTPYSMPTASYWLSPVYTANGKYIALGNVAGGYPGMAISDDGATWVGRTITTGVGITGDHGIGYGIGRYIYSNGNRIYTSTDGITWGFLTVTTVSGTHLSIFELGSEAIIIFTNGYTRRTSSFASWSGSNPMTATIGSGTVTILSIAFDGTHYCAVCLDSLTSSRRLWKTTDFSTWTMGAPIPDVTPLTPRSTMYYPGTYMFVAGSSSALRVYTSEDGGLNWSATSDISTGASSNPGAWLVPGTTIKALIRSISAVYTRSGFTLGGPPIEFWQNLVGTSQTL